MPALRPGDRVPTFSAPDQSGYLWSHDDLLGSRAVMLFLAAPAGPDELAAARALQDHMRDFQALETLVFAVSPSPVPHNARLVAVERLTFPVLADANRSLAEGFGVLADGVVRPATFLIGPSARVQGVYRDLDPVLHAAEVVRDILDVVRPRYRWTGARARHAAPRAP